MIKDTLEILRRRHAANGRLMSLGKLSKMTGVAQSTLSRILDGQEDVRLVNQKKIAEAFHVTLAQLRGEEPLPDDPRPKVAPVSAVESGVDGHDGHDGHGSAVKSEIAPQGERRQFGRRASDFTTGGLTGTARSVETILAAYRAAKPEDRGMILALVHELDRQLSAGDKEAPPTS